MDYVSKYFDWFTVQRKKFQVAQQRDIDLVDLGNVTQASRVIRGSDEARVTELKNESACAKFERFGAKLMESSAKLVCFKT